MQLAPTVARQDTPTLIGMQQQPAQQFIYVTEMDGTGGYLKRAGGDAKAALEQAIAAAKAMSAGDAPAAMVFQGPGEDTVVVVTSFDDLKAKAADVKPYVLHGNEVVLSPFAVAIVDGEQQAKLVELGP